MSHIDFTIVGSGIVGLNCALYLRKRFPKAKILILEKGVLPQGASTKNAGFACFGSISEILADLKNHSEEEVVNLVRRRWDGIRLLRENLGDDKMDFRNYGGHELFLDTHKEEYINCLDQMGEVNNMLLPVFGQKAFKTLPNTFNFKKIQQNYITNVLESQIDTGKMMKALLDLVRKNGMTILNSVCVRDFVDYTAHVSVKTDHFEFKTRKLLIATNGFASQLLSEDIRPARAQVLITKPIKNLHIKGTFHMDEGYYYFRNVANQILFGGARNLDFDAEETTTFGETKLVQNQLETLLKEIILPDVPLEIDCSWSGIMGMGLQKRPIIKQLSNNVCCGVRLGGMGIAIGSLVGKELADILR